MGGGGITKSFHNNQSYKTTITPIFKQAMPYQQGDRGTSFEPINKPRAGLNNFENLKNREEMV